MKVKSDCYACSHCIVHEHELVIEYHEGDYDKELHKDFKIQQAAMPDFSPDFDMLADLRSAHFKIELQDIEDYVAFIHERGNIVGNRKNAILTDTPNQVVISSLFKHIQGHLPQKVKIFSTVQAAIRWLGKDLTANHIKELIQDL